MQDNKNQEVFHKTSINWYPGHMAKTKNEIKDKLDLIDIVYELVDSRIPFSSKITDMDELIKNKPRILIMTKKDLCDLNETNKWVKYYEEKGYNVLILDLTNNKDYKELVNLTNKLSKSIQLKRINKGLKEKEIKVLVVGIPNVGKSTLINQMANKKVSKVGNMPGITKQLNWLKTKYNILLLDTPGILWPKFESDEVSLNLASTNAIKNEILPTTEVALHILNTLNKYYPNILNSRYKIDSLTNDIETDYAIIGKNIGAIKNNEVDYERISEFILNDIRLGKIRGITFDQYK